MKAQKDQDIEISVYNWAQLILFVSYNKINAAFKKLSHIDSLGLMASILMSLPLCHRIVVGSVVKG